MSDIIDRNQQEWYYSQQVKKHFFNPRNFLVDEPKKKEFDAMGKTGASVCGDVMKMWINVDKKSNQIKDCKWRTFGCASAIAATSMLSVMVTEKGGMKLDKAYKITPRDITQKLGGLPLQKIHCSVLGDQALRKVIDNYHKSHKSVK